MENPYRQHNDGTGWQKALVDNAGGDGAAVAAGGGGGPQPAGGRGRWG